MLTWFAQRTLAIGGRIMAVPAGLVVLICLIRDDRVRGEAAMPYLIGGLIAIAIASYLKWQHQRAM